MDPHPMFARKTRYFHSTHVVLNRLTLVSTSSVSRLSLALDINGLICLISVPYWLFFQTYHLKEKTGLMGVISSFWTKINQPFQPGVPEPQDPRTRVLSQPFSRDKLHLWVPAFVDSQTIVKEHLQIASPCGGLIGCLFILQIWYKVEKQLVQQCNTRSNCKYR